MKLFKKVVRLLKINSHKAADALYDAIDDLEQSKRDLDKEIYALMERAVNTKTKFKGLDRSLSDIDGDLSDLKHKAQKAKQEGNTQEASLYAERYVRKEQMKSQYAAILDKQIGYEQRIRSAVDQLKLKREELDFEIEMLSARKEMAETNINFHEKVNGTLNSGDSVKEAIAKAKKSIDTMEDRSEALDEVSEEYEDNNQDSSTAQVSSKAQELLDSL